MTTTPPPYQGAPAPAPQPIQQAPVKKGRNTVGIIALIISAIGFIFACIPGALIVGWVSLPVGFILGIVGLFMSGKPKWQAITAVIISIVGTIVGVIVFMTVVATAFNDSFGGSESSVGDSTVVEETDEEQPADTEEAAGDEVGTRANPAPLGAPIEGEDWTVVVNSVDLDANEEVAAENEFNEPADEGTVYISVNVTITYTGNDPDGQSPAFVGIDYVTADGVTVDAFEKLVVGPDELDSLSPLYEGASATGNRTIQVPAPADGVLAVSPGMIADKIFVAIK